MKKKGYKIAWRGLVTNKAFDLLIVILGVTVAFQLNNLKQRSDDRNLEKFFLESIVIDLNKDLEEYQDNLSVLKVNQKVALAAIHRMEKSKRNADSLGFVVTAISSIKTFEGHNNTYTTIRNENGLSIIRNGEIRNLIMDHYRLYAAIERFESVYLDHIEDMQNYFSQYIDYNHLDGALKQGGAGNMRTKNLIVISANQLQNGIWRYEGSINKALELKRAIEDYLNH